jgi:hypothetical protein
MNREIKIIVNSLLVFIFTLLIATCASRPQSVEPSGTAQGPGAFRSNGERIYFTSTSDRGTNITYTWGPDLGGFRGDNGSSGGMMGNGNLTCASCHGPDGRGGVSNMMGMQTVNSPDIRWSALKREFNTEKFRLAVTQGQDPDGSKQLNSYMPRGISATMTWLT